MNQTIRQLLDGKAENHMLPFFWQHGEDEATLRHYMDVIQKANCHAVCVESRPHPDFAGPKWWQDMDIILDEARKRNMKVWILDDSHFPTGYANGALEGKPDSLCKQAVFMSKYGLDGKEDIFTLNLRNAGLLEMRHPRFEPPKRVFHDDAILYVGAEDSMGNVIDLTDRVRGEVLSWNKPAGEWSLRVVVKSRNTGSRRNYINVTE